MDHWALMPDGLGFIQAAALPMAVVTAYSTLEIFGGTTGQVILIHGAGLTIGYAAVQIALLRGARVLATAGSTYAGDLAAMGATVTSYGQGMAERVLELAGGPGRPRPGHRTGRRLPCPTWSRSRAATPAAS